MKYKGGQKVSKGGYWCFSTGQYTNIKDGDILPGTHRYYRIPLAAVLLVAPVMGLLYAMFLPLVGLVACGVGVFNWAGTKLMDGMIRSGSFGWRPSEAYLLGRKKRKK